MKRMIKLSCFLLALLMLVLTFAACDDQKKEGLTTTPATTTTTSNGGNGGPQESYDENGYMNDHIDRDSIDYGGRAVPVLAWRQNKDMLFPESEVDGESLINVVYERNYQIEQELGIELHPTFKSAHMSSGSDAAELYNEVMAGKVAYDAVVCYSHYPAMMAAEGKLVDLSAMEFPETDMPWYPEGLSSWGFNNRLFFVANNSCVQNILASWCIFANRTMIEDKGLKDIEQVVLDGDWTLDMLKQYSRNWATEAESNNPDDKEDPNNVYGLALTHRTTMSGFYHGAGFSVYSKDETDYPVALYNQAAQVEQISRFVDTFLDICKSPEFMMGNYSGEIYYPLENKNTAFFAASLDAYTHLDDYTYCVIPMPKLNDQQENYCTLTRDITELWCILSNSEDPEVGGLLIEATSSSDYRLMAPKFFDKDFKYRYSSDDNGVKIFDLLRSSFVTEFGAVWSQEVAGPYGFLWDCLDHTGGDDPQNTLENTYANTAGGTTAQVALKLHQLKQKMDQMFPAE